MRVSNSSAQRSSTSGRALLMRDVTERLKPAMWAYRGLYGEVIHSPRIRLGRHRVEDNLVVSGLSCCCCPYLVLHLWWSFTDPPPVSTFLSHPVADSCRRLLPARIGVPRSPLVLLLPDRRGISPFGRETPTVSCELSRGEEDARGAPPTPTAQREVYDVHGAILRHRLGQAPHTRGARGILLAHDTPRPCDPL